MADDIDSLTDQLSKVAVEESILSFAGKTLQISTKEEAEDICRQIKECSALDGLNLEGNSFGVEACQAIGSSIAKHPEFKRGLFKDIFTGRLKTEIPASVESLGNGVIEAGAKLVELDFSDNAFGPIGVDGLVKLLKSQACFSLKKLSLNNTGLGPQGGKRLAKTLHEAFDLSKSAGHPMALEVFILGRSRQENQGAVALAKVFKLMGSLREISLPQNGIYHRGIAELADALAQNPKLRVLNLNDNTLTKRGAEALGKVLPSLKQLEVLDLGDCLLRSTGAVEIAKGIETLKNLTNLNLSFNEIRPESALVVASSVKNNSNLKEVNLDGNAFGEDGCQKVKAAFESNGQGNVLASMDDDEGSEEEDEAEDDEDEDSEDDEDFEDEEDVVEVIDDDECGEETESSSKGAGGDESGSDVEELVFVKATGEKQIALIEEAEAEIQPESCNAATFIESPSKERLMGLEEVDAVAAIVGDDPQKALEFVFRQLCPMMSVNNSTLLMRAINLSDSILEKSFEKDSTKSEALLVKYAEDKSQSWSLPNAHKLLTPCLTKPYVPIKAKERLNAFFIENDHAKFYL